MLPTMRGNGALEQEGEAPVLDETELAHGSYGSWVLARRLQAGQAPTPSLGNDGTTEGRADSLTLVSASNHPVTQVSDARVDAFSAEDILPAGSDRGVRPFQHQHHCSDDLAGDFGNQVLQHTWLARGDRPADLLVDLFRCAALAEAKPGLVAGSDGTDDNGLAEPGALAAHDVTWRPGKQACIRTSLALRRGSTGRHATA